MKLIRTQIEFVIVQRIPDESQICNEQSATFIWIPLCIFNVIENIQNFFTATNFVLPMILNIDIIEIVQII